MHTQRNDEQSRAIECFAMRETVQNRDESLASYRERASTRNRPRNLFICGITQFQALR